MTLFANADVHLEKKALQELRSFLELQTTVDRIREADPEFFTASDPGIEAVAITPDFHKGAGIPIGTVTRTRGFIAPQAIGRDVNCGMRLLVTDWEADAIRQKLPQLKKHIRHVFFSGGRNIPMDRRHKTALLREGLPGLLAHAKARREEGIWRYYRPEEQLRDLDRVIDRGQLPTLRVIRMLEITWADRMSPATARSAPSVGAIILWKCSKW